MKKLKYLFILFIILLSCIEIKSNVVPKFNGTDQKLFEISCNLILETTPIEKQEELKEAIAMLLIFGTGAIDDDKELKWERLRKQLDGMTRIEALKYIEKRAKEDYE
jgi:hypothetical protein